uniref:Uncharacterized protein n=1 Tax=Arundo donax TaxID=35708 RepID=A0A0A9F1F3_ARUDO
MISGKMNMSQQIIDRNVKVNYSNKRSTTTLPHETRNKFTAAF